MLVLRCASTTASSVRVDRCVERCVERCPLIEWCVRRGARPVSSPPCLLLSSACQAMKRAVQIAAYGTGSKNKTIALAEEQRWRSRRPLFASVTRLKFASAYMPLAKSVTDVSLPRFSYSYRDESPEVYPKVSQRVDKMP
jgi:hypothetical protein